NFGVEIDDGAAGNTIGGLTAGGRNVISGNDVGVVVAFGSTRTSVVGNYIGTNAAGSATIGNTEHGISIYQASANTVGGSIAGARNIISGNAVEGVVLQGGGDSNAVVGNYIGTDASGEVAIPNGVYGVGIAGDTNSEIGGTTPLARNVISGNLIDGLNVDS